MKRTNKIYNVTLAKYAWIPVEAESTEEAMEIARKYADSVDDDAFDDCYPEVDSCEAYASDIDDYEDHETIYTRDKEMTAREYFDELKAQENDNQ